MAVFKARKLKKGLFEILGLEEFIEAKLQALKKTVAPVKQAPARPASREATPFDKLVAAMEKHPRRADLVRAGKEKDQLLRSLVPLYLARNLGIEVNSGLISRFWKHYGVKYAPPNAAKALRMHVGYARQTKAGRQITPNGVKYVEAALERAA